MGEVAPRSEVGGGGAATPPVPTFGRSTLPIKGREAALLYGKSPKLTFFFRRGRSQTTPG